MVQSTCPPTPTLVHVLALSNLAPSSCPRDEPEPQPTYYSVLRQAVD